MIIHATTVRFSMNPVAAKIYKYNASLIVSIWPLSLLSAPPIEPSARRAASTMNDVVVAMVTTLICVQRLRFTRHTGRCSDTQRG